jgi:hypothetical protein
VDQSGVAKIDLTEFLRQSGNLETLPSSATADEVSEVLQFHDATDVQVGYGIYINSILGVNLQ